MTSRFSTRTGFRPPRGLLMAAALSIALVGGASPLAARTEMPATTTTCDVPDSLLASRSALPHATQRLRRGDALKIVALGSSSTAGAGASEPEASYPSRLQAELQRMFPRSAIAVVNKGIGGQDSHQMLARFRRDVIAEKPDLVIWQTGTNSALIDADVESFVDDLMRGIEMARRAGIDVMLMGPQNAPRVQTARHRRAFTEHVLLVAAIKRVPLFPRYEVMTHWLNSGQFTRETMIDPDGLHMTDASYFCLGRLVARMIANLAGASTVGAR
ncbi:MAG: SGNH/GDSL hydrolase family protein [Rhodospirillales bacterium]|nr:SGNH/GDSL hydrolase family protein [Rhodospirillales bacterium]